MRTNTKLRSAVLAGMACATFVLASVPAQGAGGTVTGDWSRAPGDISCDGATDVSVALDGMTGIAGSPTDVMLTLDRSGSMNGQPLADLKSAASAFVDILDEATDGTLDGIIANGSRIGSVSFGTDASLDQGLTSNADAVKAAINGLGAAGLTNHEAAFQASQAELAGSEAGNQKVMIMFTDGDTTIGGDPNDDAAAARAAGTEIYAIGLGFGIVQAALNEWATDPDHEHVFIAPTSAQLDQIFQQIGAAIAVPAATDIEVVETVDDHFSVSNASVSKGNLAVNGNQLTWTIDELGTETVALTYTATHDATKAGGLEQVSDGTTYADTEGHAVAFPNPAVRVNGCAAAIDVTPDQETNELGTPGQTHEVTGTVVDDFGAPVSGVDVDFDILSGPNAGAAGSDTTDAAGETTFSYVATQGPTGLGDDAIQGCFQGPTGAVCDTADKRWADSTAPDRACTPTVNPGGKNVPRANNEDGYYELTASDAVDPNPMIYVLDTGSGTVFGPFDSGTRIKYTEAPGSTPGQKPMPGAVDWHIKGTGDAAVYAVDGSGNQSAAVACLVPPPPK